MLTDQIRNLSNKNKIVLISIIGLILIILSVSLLKINAGEAIRNPSSNINCNYLFTLDNQNTGSTVTKNQGGTSTVIDKEPQFYRITERGTNGEVMESISFSAILYNEDSVKLLVDRSREELAKRAAQLNPEGSVMLKESQEVERQELKIKLMDQKFIPKSNGPPTTSSTFCVNEI